MQRYYKNKINPYIITSLVLIIPGIWFTLTFLTITNLKGRIISLVSYCLIIGPISVWMIIEHNRKFKGYIENLVDNEHKLRTLLEQRETLLSEIHHRVKNNLATISGIIDLQNMHTNDMEAKRVLENTQRRIQSIALVHEKLYQDYLFTNINFEEYLENLVTVISDIYENERKNIEVNIDSFPFNIDMERAIPLGLITSEIISNAYKHAFNEIDQGRITISVKKLEGNTLELLIRDNGSGYHSTEKDSSLGMTLVNALCKQIKATTKIDREDGYGFSLSFNLDEVRSN